MKDKEIPCRQTGMNRIFFSQKNLFFQKRIENPGGCGDATAASSFASMSKARNCKAAAKQTLESVSPRSFGH